MTITATAGGSPPAGHTALLEARGISKRFGGVIALDDADFVCQAGEIHALLGANGAGKSTLVKILSGVHPPDAGSIRLAGQAVTLASPAAAAAHGVATVFQELSLFPHLTVAQNVMIGHEPIGRLGQIRGRELRRQVAGLLEQLGIEHIKPQAFVSDLSLADRQLVEIAKALSHDPQVLILDEGTSALGRQEVQRLFDLLKTLRRQGKAVVFISHRMGEIRELVDRVTVFRNGRHVGSLDAEAFDENRLVEMMLGERVERSFPPRAELAADANVLLELNKLSAGTQLRDISFALRRGEVLGIAGLEGQGQGELLLALFGAYRRITGRVRMHGHEVKLGTPWRAQHAGLALIPEDRKTQGLLQRLSLRENIALASLGQLTHWGMVSRTDERKLVAGLIDRMQIKTASMELPARSLSGGNQQKVVLAKWLETSAEVFLFYDPTRGIDVGTKHHFYELIEGLAAAGKGVLLYSTEIIELIGLCHRVVVMDDGRIVRELVDQQITEPNILAASLGLEKNRDDAAAGVPA